MNSDLIESFEIIQFQFNGSLVITMILYFLNRYWVQKKVVGKYDLRIPKKYFLQPSCTVSCWFFGLLYYFGEYSLHRRINLPLPSQREYIPAGIHLLYNPYVPPGAFNQMEPNKNKCKIVTASVEVQFFLHFCCILISCSVAVKQKNRFENKYRVIIDQVHYSWISLDQMKTFS